jgi:hypothetical protein
MLDRREFFQRSTLGKARARLRTRRAKATKWPEAKKARRSSIFHVSTPFGPTRAIGPQWQNPREKPHIFGFWPTLWPEGSRDPVAYLIHH